MMIQRLFTADHILMLNHHHVSLNLSSTIHEAEDTVDLVEYVSVDKIEELIIPSADNLVTETSFEPILGGSRVSLEDFEVMKVVSQGALGKYSR
ncbi:hypothetical protein RJ641_028668 [Dillenia turbinata]|uniref:Uncharacterized protein n=1 Tax=Dillenia turbinata TaxID=194707 RepID=A0AAN8ZMI6_9MAGN